MPSSSLSPHCQKVLSLLSKSPKPLTAYDMLDKLHKHGIKAPPTIYRALETLQERGLIHRIETLGAFVACHEHGNDTTQAQFAVCRHCGSVEEFHNPALSEAIRLLAASLTFRVEREMLELVGLCQRCSTAGET